MIEEHYVVVGKPEEVHLTHVAPQDGIGRSIAQLHLMLLKIHRCMIELI